LEKVRFRILITGASGNVGREVVKQALAVGLKIRATFQSPDIAAKAPAGLEGVMIDYAKPETIRPVLHGVQKIFLVGPPVRSHPMFTHATKKVRSDFIAAGAKFFPALRSAVTTSLSFLRWRRLRVVANRSARSILGGRGRHRVCRVASRKVWRRRLTGNRASRSDRWLEPL